MTKLTILLLFIHLGCVLSNREDYVSYHNYKIYNVAHCESSLGKGIESFTVLKQSRQFNDEGKPYCVRSYLVPFEKEEQFIKGLQAQHVEYKISDENLGMSIQEERAQSSRRFNLGSTIYEVYRSYDEILEYVSKLRSFKNPMNNEPLVLVESIGKTYEGRDMVLVKISNNHAARKPVIFFEIGIHAREWVAPATGLYMMYQLVENYTYNAHLLDKIDFYMVPVSNPDGYEYSRARNRLWRKTRSFYRHAYGTDGNRNFDFHWGEGGTSSDPSSDIFKGPFPFSEVEMRNIRDAGYRYARRIKTFVSVHCYGPYILYPWGYKTDQKAPQADLMRQIGREAAAAIAKINGTRYEVGSSVELLYEAAGGADDYFKGVLGVDLAFTVELSSKGRNSFIVPATEIYDIAHEAFEGFKVMAKYAANYKTINK